MTNVMTLIPSDQVHILGRLIGTRLTSYGASKLLKGTRTAIGQAFIENDKGEVVLIYSDLRSYAINQVIDDFATISIREGDLSVVEASSKQGNSFYDFSDSLITNVGIIRVDFIREALGNPNQSCSIDLGLLIETEIGRLAIFNSSIWVNEIDLEVLRVDMELAEPDGFASEIGDAWESRTTVVKISS